MSQDSIVIYRDIKEAVMDLPPELCKKVIGVLFDYAFDDIEPDESEDVMVRSFFKVVKSRFDMNTARRERCIQNGKKGGNPNLTKKGSPQPTATKSQPKTTKSQPTATKSNQEPTQDNQDTTNGNQEPTQDNQEPTLYQYPYQYNNIVVDVDNAHTRESEDGAVEEENEAEDYEAFLNEFFKETNRSNIEVICMQLKATPETLRKEAKEIVAEWRLTKVQHQDYSDTARHLVNQLRVRYNVKQKEDDRKQKQSAKGTATAKGEFGGVCETPAKKKHLRSTI